MRLAELEHGDRAVDAVHARLRERAGEAGRDVGGAAAEVDGPPAAELGEVLAEATRRTRRAVR